MFCFRSVSRLIAATTLVISGAAVATVVSTVPAGAVNNALTFNCGTGYSSATVANGATVTVTVGTSCTGFTFGGINGAAPQGSARLNGSDVPPSQLIPVVQGNTIVFTAPASGSGEDALTFVAGQNPGDGVVISYPAPTGSLTDNGNGTMTVTYSGSIVGFLLPSGSVCAASLAVRPSNFNYILATDAPPGGQLAASPAVIAVGTPLMGMGDPTPVPVTAGAYQACLYESVGPGGPLLSSLAVTIGQVTPDPIAPSFTG
jgi:hypothetical protein